MSQYTAIGSCLETYLAATAGLPYIKYQNTDYNPVSGTSFIQCEVMPTSRRRSAMGPGQLKRSQGLFIINACTPENLGPGAGSDLADIVMTRFDIDSPIISGGIAVYIEYSEVVKSFNMSPFYCAPVQVSWYSYTT